MNTKVLDMSSFLRFAITLYSKSLSRSSPETWSPIIFSLYCLWLQRSKSSISWWKRWPCFSEYNPMFSIKMSIKDVDFESSSPESQPTPHSFWLCDCPGSPEPLQQSCSNHFLLPSELLGDFLALQELLYLWSDEDTGFDFVSSSLGKNPWGSLKTPYLELW